MERWGVNSKNVENKVKSGELGWWYMLLTKTGIHGPTR